MWKSIVGAVALLGFVIGNASAATVVLDFNGTSPDSDSTPFISSYSEDGFTVEQNAGRSFFIDNDFVSNNPAFVNFVTWDDDVLEFDQTGTVVTIRQSNGAHFDFLSADLGSIHTSFGSSSLTFTGLFDAGGNISNSVTSFPGLAPATTFFQGFEQLSSLIISAPTDGQFPIIDNITLSTVSAVPVPAALPLFAAALAGFGLLRLKRPKTA